MHKREKTMTDLMERSPASPDGRRTPILSPLKEGEVTKNPISISEIVRQPTNQLLRRESAGALILDAIAQKVSFVPKGMDHRSLCLLTFAKHIIISYTGTCLFCFR